MKKGSFFQRLYSDCEPVIRHAISMAVTIVCIWGFQFLLKRTLGEDAKLFDRLPIIYVAQLGDLLAFLRFFWKLIKEF
jgi:hypothetical protein